MQRPGWGGSILLYMVCIPQAQYQPLRMTYTTI